MQFSKLLLSKPVSLSIYMIITTISSISFAKVISEEKLIADVILVNGKIITMDSDFADKGTIAEAIAVRGDTILSVGNKEAILSYAGSDTQVIDLKGKTVIPGIIDNHSHIHDYAIDHWAKEFGLSEFVADARVNADSIDDLKRATLATLAHVAPSKKKDEWIKIDVPSGPRSAYQTALIDGKYLTNSDLDSVASDNPVWISMGIRSVFNSKAIQVLVDYFGDLDPEFDQTTGISTSEFISRSIYNDLLTNMDPSVLLPMYEAELKEWASFGTTTWASSMGDTTPLRALEILDRQNKMPMRFAYSIGQPIARTSNQESAKLAYANLATIVPTITKSNRIWLMGMSVTSLDGAYPLMRTNITEVSPEIKNREYDKGAIRFNALKSAIQTRQRVAGVHVAGNATLDMLLDVIEEGSRLGGITKDEIRATNHVVDHCAFNPRPDQYGRLKDLNITMSCAPKYLNGVTADVKAEYGDEYVFWVVPVGSMLDAGVSVTYQVDTHEIANRPGHHFYYMKLLEDRKDDDGNIWAPDEAANRMETLAMATRWASKYVLMSEKIGSLETGKWADLVVLDRDYAKIPVDELTKINVLLTMVGGKLEYTEPAFASENSLPQVGFRQ